MNVNNLANPGVPQIIELLWLPLVIQDEDAEQRAQWVTVSAVTCHEIMAEIGNVLFVQPERDLLPVSGVVHYERLR
jgi:hypothetical protein